MSALVKTIFGSLAEVLATPVKRYILLIVILILAALLDFFYLGLARRTFVFYTINDGNIVVEDRMLKHSRTTGARSREGDIIQYVDETLLGPVSPDLLPLFPRGTRLISLLYREGVVYANFTVNAAMPPIEGGNLLDNFRTFYAGILRNFSFVRDVRFFIEGNAIFVDEFRQMTAGDNHGFSEI